MSASQLSTVWRSSPISSFVRRLDWRFLLPQPHLSVVAYIGHATGTLWPAVEAFSDSAIRLATPGTTAGIARVLVAQETSAAATKGALDAISAGGSLYWELPRTRNPLASWRRTLRRWGLIDACAHWHHPNFDACELIVPLSDPVAIASVLRRRFPRVKARTLLIFSHGLARLPALWVLLPAVSISAQVPEAT